MKKFREIDMTELNQRMVEAGQTPDKRDGTITVYRGWFLFHAQRIGLNWCLTMMTRLRAYQRKRGWTESKAK